MGRLVKIVKIGFYLGKLALSVVWVLPYFRWRIWTAKRAFKKQLKREGLPEELVRSLGDNYNRQNKWVFGLITERVARRKGSGTAEAAGLELKLTGELK